MFFQFKAGQVAINIRDRAGLRRQVSRRLAARQGFALATINLDHIVKLRRDETFLRAYQKQDFVVADGRPVVWLSRLARRSVALMPGSDLVLPLCRLAAEAEANVALIGSTKEVLEEARRKLCADVPGLHVTWLHAPAQGFDPEGSEARAILAELDNREIGLCFLALGAPKQECFARFGRSRAPRVGFVSVGAGLDFIGGQSRRAPPWVRRIAMEWLWRMLGDPRRLGPRYLACFLALPGLAAHALFLRSNPTVNVIAPAPGASAGAGKTDPKRQTSAQRPGQSGQGSKKSGQNS